MAVSGKTDNRKGRSGSQCIDWLIMQTRGEWRIPLLDMLKAHKQMHHVKSLFAFLISNIRSASSAREQGTDVNVYIDYTNVPAQIDLINWRRVLIGINLVLCEPDTNRDIQMIGVSTSKESDVDVIQGFLITLQGLYGLPWDVLQLVLYMNYKSASVLYETLIDTTQGYPLPPIYTDHIRELYQNNMIVMRQIGFYRTSENTPITWSQPRMDVGSLLNSLHALYRNPVGVQEQQRV